jgi:hypothetical protein
LHTFPRKEGGIKVLACLALSNLTVAFLLRTSWVAKPARKNSAKDEFDEFTSMEKYTQPVLRECIWQSK